MSRGASPKWLNLNCSSEKLFSESSYRDIEEMAISGSLLRRSRPIDETLEGGQSAEAATCPQSELRSKVRCDQMPKPAPSKIPLLVFTLERQKLIWIFEQACVGTKATVTPSISCVFRLNIEFNLGIALGLHGIMP